ncbi:RDD family protein [Psychroserpens ponticola]|uniref:RDD family protein n=1 Tax=Psychroserpens ponticola TaxID=2932268 RepID=A0ABY7RZW8_9FLAO|nr:RDD family protein [Psychroserpens ponticola]WCO02583.1 RDD family protein [Psychroserpens ponticola]
MSTIDKSTRLTNYIIDLFVIYILFFVFSIIENSYHTNYLALHTIMFSYYSILEITTSQTLGKMITKTKVVTKNGHKPHFFKIIIRSLARVIPFDALSYLFGSENGMHDSVSNTRLVKK